MYVVLQSDMYELSGCLIKLRREIHFIPQISSEMQFESGWFIFAVIIPILKTSSDQVLGAICDVYFVAVPHSLRKAPYVPVWLIIVQIMISR